eukprot:INCI7175.4.p1 GENE.INCI7175.4~~INCI7175.4.p1  ORF type:complete len:1381 (+),score=176.24 INCI7175.4:621-4145(+)
MSQGAAYLFGLGLAFYITYALCDSNFNAERYELAVDGYLVNYSLGSMSGCQTASLTPDDFVFPDSDLGNGSFSCGSYLGPDAGRCTVYSALVVFSRLYGFIFESFFIRLTVAFVALQGMSVMNFLPARVMFFAVPFGLIVLLSILCQFPLETAMSNMHNSIISALPCNKHLVVTLVAFFFEVSISVFAAGVSLVLQSVSRSRLKRELFFWTKKLDVEMAALENEANPFRKQAIRKWLAEAQTGSRRNRSGVTSGKDGSNSGQTAVPAPAVDTRDTTSKTESASVEEMGASAHFWDISNEELKLVERVAAGAAGSVWRASYRGHAVAAKQLNAMSDLVGLDDALVELVNEVVILGQLQNPYVVKLLGLCQDTDENGVLQVFIVQEWCDRNLRNYMQDSAFFSRQMSSGKPGCPDAETVAVQLACGMKYLHDRDIIHRDLKPENVLLTAAGTVRICDFGVSHAKSASAATTKAAAAAAAEAQQKMQQDEDFSKFPEPRDAHRRSSAAAPERRYDFEYGTMLYMPPEIYEHFLRQTSCTEALTTVADVYAFGVIVWELFMEVNDDAERILMSSAQYTERTRETLLNAPRSAMLHSLCSLWKSPNPAKMVPVAPSFVRDIVASCTSVAASQRPAFKKIAADLIAGPVRRFSAVHQGAHPRARLMPSRSSLSILGKGRRIDRAIGRRHSGARQPTASTYAITTSSTSSQDVQIAEVGTAANTPVKPAKTVLDASLSTAIAAARGSPGGRPLELSGSLGLGDGGSSPAAKCRRCRQKYLMSFPDAAMERRFCAEYVQSNSHYQAARYVLSLVLGVYFVYFFATVGVRAYFGLGFEEDPDALRTVVVPAMNVVLFTFATVLAFKPTWREAAAWELVIIVPLGVCSCIVVPWLSYSQLDVDNGELFTGGLFGYSHIASTNTSVFVEGWLQGSEGEICGGIGDPAANDSSPVSLCQTLSYSAGVGNMAFCITMIPVLQSLTIPAILMTVALPFRLYVVALTAPAVGCALQVYTTYQEISLSANVANFLMTAHGPAQVGTQYVWMYVALYMVIVYGSCLASALVNERYNRSLFTIRCALDAQKEALVNERDTTQYRYILQQNRQHIGGAPVSTAAASSISPVSGARKGSVPIPVRRSESMTSLMRRYSAATEARRLTADKTGGFVGSDHRSSSVTDMTTRRSFV